MIKQKLVDYINSMGIEEKIALHNTYCDAANCMDDCIYTMDKMEEILDRFDFKKDFWGFSGYGNLVSYDARELPIFASDIAHYILSEEDSLGNDEIKEILDGGDNDND